MATLEALDELYSMGFLVEEEYLARRAGLGAGPPQPKTNSMPDPPSIPYHSHTEPTTIPESVYAYVPTYEQSDRPYDSLYPDVSTPDLSPSSEPLQHPHEMIPTPNVHASHQSHTETPSHRPRVPIQPEGPYPTIPIERDFESLTHLRITPLEDSSKPEVWIAHPNMATIVHRSEGCYSVRQVHAPSRAWDVQKELGLSGQLFESGKAVSKIERELYWSTKRWIMPDPADDIEPGKVYVFKQSCQSNFSSYLDERVFIRYCHSLLERTPCTSNYDIYAGDDRIRDVRLFEKMPTPTAFDPRLFVDFMNSKTPKRFEIPHPGPHCKVKLKCSPTPAFMLWPSLVAVLRSMELRFPDNVTRHLPKSSPEILAKLRKSVDNQECYFSGRPTSPGSFLAPEYHNDELVELYQKIKASSSLPNCADISEGVGKISVEPDAEERIHYDVGEAPRSYGWPSQEDSAIASSPLCVPRLGIKPICRVRQQNVSQLISELMTKNGPPAGSK